MFINGIMRLIATTVFTLAILFQPHEVLPDKVLPQEVLSDKESHLAAHTGVKVPRLIAHAGGAVNGIRLTNSLQALDSSYSKGFRYFELDMNWTRDHVPVLVHDWGNVNWLLGIKYSTEPQTSHDFMQGKAIRNLQFMDLDSLEEWCSQHKDATVISDIKSENVGLLGIIKEKYPHIYSGIIPQIYSFDQYDPVKDLGYQNILLSVCKLDAPGKDILDFCSSHSLFGASLYDDGINYDLLHELNDMGIRTFIHPVNEYNQYIKLRESGAYGVFTDYLEPCNWLE